MSSKSIENVDKMLRSEEFVELALIALLDLDGNVALQLLTKVLSDKFTDGNADKLLGPYRIFLLQDYKYNSVYNPIYETHVFKGGELVESKVLSGRSNYSYAAKIILNDVRESVEDNQ